MAPITPANKIKNDKRSGAGKAQTPKELIPTPALKKAFSEPTAHPPPKKGEPTHRNGIKIDSKQSHHTGVPLDSFTEFTAGFTEKQKQATRLALEKQGLLTGDHLLNSTDLWRRYHQGKSSGPYKGQGSHQRTNALGIDGAKSKKKWQSLSPKERFSQIDSFVADMGANRKIAQESDFASRQLLGSNNTPDNEFGGNFSQRIINPRHAENAALNSANARAQRQLYQPSVPREMSPATKQAQELKVPKPPSGRRSAGSARTMRPTSRVPRAEAGFVSMPEVKLPNKKQLLSMASHFIPGPSKQAITALSSGPVQEDTRSTGLKVVDTLTGGLEPIKSLVRQANPQLDEEKDLQQTSNEVQKFLKNPLNELKWGLKILQSGM